MLRRRLIDHLAAYYDDPAKARLAAETAGLVWVTLATLKAPSVRALWAAIFAEAEGTSVEECLVRNAIAEAGALGGRIQEVWQKRPDRKPIANVPTLDAHVLARKRCFINRKALREQLAALKDERRRILIVNGPLAPAQFKLGKSYTRELVQHLASVEANFGVAYVEHVRKDGPSLPPDRLAEAIAVDELGAPPGAPGPQNDTEEAWARRVCAWLVQSVRTVPGNWWLILDGLRDDNLPGATYELVGKLAAKVARQTGTINIKRLILIDYPADRLPGEVAGETVSETVEPMTSDHLDEYFRGLLTQRGEVYDDDAIASLVDKVWAPTIGLNPEDRLRTLGDNVDSVLGRMFPE